MERKKFEFVKPKVIKTIEKDPESIFRELQIPNVKGLWSQQADILREYYNTFKTKQDVAIELPTGTGKTLIGLLIAEYRRRCLQERVLYLCPTRQLARQVYLKAIEYGLPASLLIGPQNKYPEEAYGDYVTNKCVAITTYSAIYNTNPKLDDADAILFDDAHSAENYISSLWTVEIKRKENKEVFESIIKLFKDDISDYHYTRIMSEDAEYYKPIYDLIPYPKYLEKLPQLIELLEANITKCGDAKYPWSKINENLEACQLFFSWGEINIRPLIPPTQTHGAFNSAKQRIYMSATLGEGGELERITGVRKINKIPIPKGWEKYSNGRRLILFPNRVFNPEDSLNVAIGAIQNQGRALVLCPDNRTAQYFISKAEEKLPGYSILQSWDIEDSLDSFTNKNKAILVLTNRYDGIDLSGDICRLQIVYGMPEATNLQEGFLWNRLNANTVLSELVKTRITQALGRCTRSSDDFANVLMLDPNLLKFCASRDNLIGFHPEIQAEIEFGLDNSEKIESIQQMVDFMNDFINDKDYYSSINDAITEIREEYEKKPKTEVKKLILSVENEIDFVYALWKMELDRALEKAKSTLENLSGGKELDGYRAWWFYIAGNAAHLAKNYISIDPNLDKNYYSSTLRITSGISWLSDLIHYVPIESDVPKIDPYLAAQTDNIDTVISDLGIVGTMFEKNMKQLLELINDDDAKKFESGLVNLGRVLGYVSSKPNSDTAPDGVWILRDRILGFEAKTEEDEQNPVYSEACRQADGHKKWIRENVPFPDGSTVEVALISHKSKIRRDALPQSRGLFHINVSDIRELALKTTSVLRSIRSVIVKQKGPNLFLKEHISNTLSSEKLTYRDIEELFKTKSLDELNHY
ncbi:MULTISPECIES: DEAD/DEAH box helicase family protein [unclassified Bacillus (in: firmicutes)]|uniref:DEAD/DEAH box helicase family protein n=1 Tax=unclassified Bacillus (in: firmicutes) TaxID=185979 RepID=UPI001BE69613|nr:MULTISPECIES: DEAD/DEAH box helicase family protein [unclassified Bacillus (in: firmicutes)]MBT2617247.1 DEAD/DEAH box helicase family protein [Bacillus sp. ISL-78]MBT2627818.1 DEAD/DEAH box helicase family protein [Bacillus sp. ISL-101]